MKKVLCMTVHNRTPDIIKAVFSGLSLPGNTPDEIAVCFDRIEDKTAAFYVKYHCDQLEIPLKFVELNDGSTGPRCPSRAWNAAFDLVDETHAFCISSDVVLAPHSLDMAYHISRIVPGDIICGRTEHSGPSYKWELFDPEERDKVFMSTRTMTASYMPRPLGFNWLLPMERVRRIGGYDENFMDGMCYEDDDFVIRMWNAGANIVFCDDVFGMHVEHSREFLSDAVKVERNAEIFERRYGAKDYLKEGHLARCDMFSPHIPGLRAWMKGMSRDEYEILFRRIIGAQYSYGRGEAWRAVDEGGGE